MKKGLLIMLCLSLVAFAPACRKRSERYENGKNKPAMAKKTTKVKTKNTYKSRKATPAKGKSKKVVVEETTSK